MKPRIEVMVYSTSEWLVGKTAWIRELKKEAIPLYEEPVSL